MFRKVNYLVEIIDYFIKIVPLGSSLTYKKIEPFLTFKIHFQKGMILNDNEL
jgi:hypothetical protein